MIRVWGLTRKNEGEEWYPASWTREWNSAVWRAASWNIRAELVAAEAGLEGKHLIPLLWGEEEDLRWAKGEDTLETAWELMSTWNTSMSWPGAYSRLANLLVASQERSVLVPKKTKLPYTLAQCWFEKETEDDGGKRLGEEAMQAVRSMLGGSNG